jgi:hypothetical protein
VRSALAWKCLYEAERAALGTRGLDALLDAAQASPLGAARIFPHTRASVTGAFVADVARSIVDAGVDRVVAIGVLHGARERDAPLVARARAGDSDAIAQLRGIHGEDGYAAEEFSLDLFVALLARAAERAKRSIRVESYYPFLVGDRPGTLPGIDALRRAVEGAALVATTDPIHHGVGYGTRARRDPSLPRTERWAERAIRAQLDGLARGDFARFAKTSACVRSDFRDVGPALAMLVPMGTCTIERLALVDYADVLGAAPPTWVAGANVRIER